MTTRLAAAQYPVTFHKTFAAWKQHTEDWVQRAALQNAQLLLFPEYGAMELVSLLLPHEQADIRLQVRALDRLLADFCAVFEALSKKYQLIIVAPSFPICQGASVHNRCFVFSPKGRQGHQDKNIMTRFENETWGVSASEARLCVFEANWGHFGIQICYDVEFPVGSALLCRAGAQLVLAPSCTETIRGATRVHVGARARALEQQCYTVVSPLIGEAPWSAAVDINYGFAAVYSTPDQFFPEEGILQQMAPQQPGWLLQDLDFSLIEKVRSDGQTLNFRDGSSETGATAYKLVREIL